MEDNFKHNHFEEFLQNQVKNYRMYANDSVWRGISSKLHGDKKWPALTIATIILLTATVFIISYFSPKSKIFTLKPSLEPIQSVAPPHSQNSLSKSPSVIAGFSNVATNFTSSPDKNALVKTPALLDASLNENATTNSRSLTVMNEYENTLTVQYSENEDILPSTILSELQSNPIQSEIRLPEKLVTSDAPESLPTIEQEHKTPGYQNIIDEFLKEKHTDFLMLVVPKQRSLKNKISLQLYVAPSISYRKLNEDILTKKNHAGPVGLNYVTDVNNVVRHKPGTGLEAGVSVMYHLSNRFRVKSGLQFNLRQYTIEAFYSSSELASIALSGGGEDDTLNTIAQYRNNNGYQQAELTNRYYQLSMPLGVEWQVIGNQRVSLNIAGSIQPTYLLSHKAYLLSTNFKNYTEDPGIVRKWNINSNVETYISFRAGDFKWQIGPQIRYQPYSSYIKEYPIKEHLLDYGLKVGVSTFGR